MDGLGTLEKEKTDGDMLLLLRQQGTWKSRLHIYIFRNADISTIAFNWVVSIVISQLQHLSTKRHIWYLNKHISYEKKTNLKLYSDHPYKIHNLVWDNRQGRHKELPASFLQTQMYWNYLWWSECIPKSPSLILPHLSLFPLANTMPFIPKRIIGQHCRRQTIYWHFASLNSTASLPGTIHFKQYVFCCTDLRHNTYQHW